jgi:integrase
MVRPAMEEAGLLKAALPERPRYYPLLLAALRTGMRIGELFGLEWGDEDFAGRFIEVRRTVRDSGRVALPQNGKIRRVDMSRQLTEELRRLRAEQSREALANGWEAVPLVFVTSKGKPIRLVNFRRRVFEPVLRTAGPRHLKIHGLRHTYASRLLQQGEGPAYVKDQVGHSSIKITVDTYGPPDPWFEPCRRGSFGHDRTQPRRNHRAEER